jgi:hypothetical protein
VFEDSGTNVGNFLASLLSNFETRCLVIGGNVSDAYLLFGVWFKNALKKQNR